MTTLSLPLLQLPNVKIHDVTVTLRKGVPSWPGEDFWSLEPVARMDKGDVCNVSKFSSGCHFGTHVDAPWHFGEGNEGVDAVPMEKMVVESRVLDLTNVKTAISRKDLEGRIDGTKAVLCKTTNSGKIQRMEPFDTEFIHLDASAADYLIEKGIETVGVDYLSVEGYHVQGAPVHHKLLHAKVFIVEGLDLSVISEGDYLMVALPLKIGGADGAPARVILIEGIKA